MPDLVGHVFENVRGYVHFPEYNKSATNNLVGRSNDFIAINKLSKTENYNRITVYTKLL